MWRYPEFLKSRAKALKVIEVADLPCCAIAIDVSDHLTKIAMIHAGQRMPHHKNPLDLREVAEERGIVSDDLRRRLEGIPEILVDGTVALYDSHIRRILRIAFESKRVRIFFRLPIMTKDKLCVGVRRFAMDMQDKCVRDAIKTLERWGVVEVRYVADLSIGNRLHAISDGSGMRICRTHSPNRNRKVVEIASMSRPNSYWKSW